MAPDVPARHAIWAALPFLIVLSANPVHADLASPRVRPVGSRVVSLLHRGYDSSPTLAALVDALERSDVIVHIQEHWLHDRSRDGETQLVAVAGGHRYVRIHLDPRIPDQAAMALLAHELQHAVEIADAMWVVDHKTLAQLYMCIGFESRAGGTSRGVDTIRAHETARHVLSELKASSVRRLSSSD
jgi:hypothetical protein